MKNIYVLFLFAILTTSIFAQSFNSDSITFVENRFIYKGNYLKPGKMLKLVEPNPEAYKEMARAKTNYNCGSAVGFIGGFMVGWPIGQAIAGGDPEWILLGIGAGLIVATIPLSNGYYKHAGEAAKIYNSGLNKPSGHADLELRLGYTPNGFGVTLIFAGK